MTVTTRFSDLQAEVSKLKLRRGTIADALDDVLDRARINADDTCHVEKAAPVEEYDRIALDTVRDILTQSETDADVVAWFASRGVEG